MKKNKKEKWFSKGKPCKRAGGRVKHCLKLWGSRTDDDHGLGIKQASEELWAKY